MTEQGQACVCIINKTQAAESINIHTEKQAHLNTTDSLIQNLSEDKLLAVLTYPLTFLEAQATSVAGPSTSLSWLDASGELVVGFTSPTESTNADDFLWLLIPGDILAFNRRILAGTRGGKHGSVLRYLAVRCIRKLLGQIRIQNAHSLACK